MCEARPVAEFIVTALPEALTWSGRPGPEPLAVLPGCPAVLLFISESGAPVQVLTTQQLKRLALARLCEHAEMRRGRADLAEVVRGVRWRAVHCPFEGRWWYYRLARVLHPQEYLKLVSFGPAWFMQVDWAQPIPEIRVSDRVWCATGECVGPWPTRGTCQQALEGLWDLFDLCRYPEQVRRAPHGTRCAYAEMGRCDAPCDGSVPLAAYTLRCRAAWRFATSGVAEWVAGATERMQQAAADQKYELAGQIKQQLQFARAWQAQWSPRVRPAAQLNYLLGLPVTRRRAWKLFLFRGGHLADGPVVPERRLGSDVTKWLGDELLRPAEELPASVRMEQTWLVAHLLFNRESDTALIVPLLDLAVPPDLEETLSAKVKVRRHPQA